MHHPWLFTRSFIYLYYIHVYVQKYMCMHISTTNTCAQCACESAACAYFVRDAADACMPPRILLYCTTHSLFLSLFLSSVSFGFRLRNKRACVWLLLVSMRYDDVNSLTCAQHYCRAAMLLGMLCVHYHSLWLREERGY